MGCILPKKRQNRNNLHLDEGSIIHIQNISPIATSAKIVIVGEPNVGKTSIFQMLIEHTFSTIKKETLGIDSVKYNVIINPNQYLPITIWDTPGTDKLRALPNMLLRSTKGVLLTYDVTDMKTFLQLGNWILNLKERIQNKCVIYVVGNKIDLVHNRCISYAEASEFCEGNNLSYFETSAKEDIGIEELFISLASRISTEFNLALYETISSENENSEQISENNGQD